MAEGAALEVAVGRVELEVEWAEREERLADEAALVVEEEEEEEEALLRRRM